MDIKKYKKILNLNKNLFESLKYEGNDIEIIRSDKSGVGKSTQIKKEIEEKGKKYIYFPFGGVITREDIIKRLKELQIDNNCILHLDLYNTDQIELMMEFLFSILILRFYGRNDEIFFLSKNIEIKVETPNDFIDYFEKFPILNLFNIRNLEISHLAPLIVPKQLDSNIQLVSIYLKALKEDKINGYDLIFPEITPPNFEENFYITKTKQKISTDIKAELLDANICQNLIFNEIKDKIKKPSYYQIITFINILAAQLKRFNQSFFLNAHQLITSKKNAYLIRTFIVKNFIECSLNISEGIFSNLLSQNNEHKFLFGQYNEEQDINNAINNLAINNHDIISFDNIKSSLLFFHEGSGGDSFSIITNKNKTDKEYNDFLALKNSQIYNQKDQIKELPNYKQYSQKEFLIELKEILNIKNPIEKGSKSNEKSLEEITSNYVFTADNFVKMILILLRIRANMPVIMMGETGCGKTALIRKLSELKNNVSSDKMKILNIHSGTNDEDIINFIIKQVIPESQKFDNNDKNNENKIWVFLDEINTCKSMGLISELM